MESQRGRGQADHPQLYQVRPTSPTTSTPSPSKDLIDVFLEGMRKGCRAPCGLLGADLPMVRGAPPYPLVRQPTEGITW